MSRINAFHTAGLASLALGLALTAPLHADPIVWVGDGSNKTVIANDIRHAGNWAGNALPINGAVGHIGGGGSPVLAYINRAADVNDPGAGNSGSGINDRITLHDAGNAETPPSEIRILNNGTLMLDNNAHVGQLNLVLDGGTLGGAGGAGTYYNTITLASDSYIGGSSMSINGAIVDADPLNPATLTINNSGGDINFKSNNNTYSGGTVVQAGARIQPFTGTVGTLGAGDLHMYGSARVRSTNLFTNPNAKIFIHDGGDIDFWPNNNAVVALDGAKFGLERSIGHTKSGAITIAGNVTIEHRGNANDDDYARWSGNISNGDSAGTLTLSAPTAMHADARLVLSGNNSYTGGTIVNNVRVNASSANALGAGDVTVNANVNALLNLLHDDAISETATLTVLHNAGVNGIVNLGANVTVASLILGENVIAGGTYTASDFSGYFTGGGSITVVPEPTSLMLMGAAGSMLLVRRRTRA